MDVLNLKEPEPSGPGNEYLKGTMWNLLVSVLQGRMVSKVITFCLKRFHCCFTNTPSCFADRTKPQKCIKSGAEKDFNVLSQLVYHLDYTWGGREKGKT